MVCSMASCWIRTRCVTQCDMSQCDMSGHKMYYGLWCIQLFEHMVGNLSRHSAEHVHVWRLMATYFGVQIYLQSLRLLSDRSGDVTKP